MKFSCSHLKKFEIRQADLAKVLDLEVPTLIQHYGNRAKRSGKGKVTYCLCCFVPWYIKKLKDEIKKLRHGSEDDPGESPAELLKKEQTKKTQLQQKKIEIDIELAQLQKQEAAGELLRKNLVEKHAGGWITSSRNKILGLPRILAPLVMGIDAASEAEEIIEDQCHKLLDDIENAGEEIVPNILKDRVKL
jgi:hypothetical protein